jgi:hypothetical protein
MEPKGSFHAHNSLPLARFLTQLNPVHTSQPIYFIFIYFWFIYRRFASCLAAPSSKLFPTSGCLTLGIFPQALLPVAFPCPSRALPSLH